MMSLDEYSRILEYGDWYDQQLTKYLEELLCDKEELSKAVRDYVDTDEIAAVVADYNKAPEANTPEEWLVLLLEIILNEDVKKHLTSRAEKLIKD